MQDLQLENRDFIYIGSDMATVALVEAKFEQLRSEYFDQELVAVPIVPESSRRLRSEDLTLDRRDYLDNAPYDLSDPVREERFNNEFDFHSAFLRAVQATTDQVFRLRRRIMREYYVVHAQYTRLYSDEIVKRTSKGMGNNDTERKAYFRKHYPALSDIDELYDSFLEEIKVEIERLQQLGSTASRSLAATENSYRARGLLNDRKVMSY